MDSVHTSVIQCMPTDCGNVIGVVYLEKSSEMKRPAISAFVLGDTNNRAFDRFDRRDCCMLRVSQLIMIVSVFYHKPFENLISDPFIITSVFQYDLFFFLLFVTWWCKTNETTCFNKSITKEEKNISENIYIEMKRQNNALCVQSSNMCCAQNFI